MSCLQQNDKYFKQHINQLIEKRFGICTVLYFSTSLISALSEHVYQELKTEVLQDYINYFCCTSKNGMEVQKKLSLSFNIHYNISYIFYLNCIFRTTFPVDITLYQAICYYNTFDGQILEIFCNLYCCYKKFLFFI